MIALRPALQELEKNLTGTPGTGTQKPIIHLQLLQHLPQSASASAMINGLHGLMDL
jgi:hypothetical protein